MKLIALVTAAVAAAMLTAAPLYASHPLHRSKHGWYQMTTRERQAVVAREAQHYRQTVRWWLNFRAELPRSRWGRICWPIGVRAPDPICVAGRHLQKALTVAERIEARLAAQARAEAERAARYAYRARLAAWTCIHSHEGAWNAETGNGYHGGLQMDSGFESTYGGEFVARWGHAGNWPIWAQLVAAQRAYDSGRGYGPWPNTARECGLL